MTEATGGHLLGADLLTTPLTPEPLPDDEVVWGRPTAGLTRLGALAGVEVGVWEMSEGAARDTEADEIFVVLAGRGEVAFADGETIELGPGVAVRLQAGDRTVWTVWERLRKVYLSV